MRSIAACFLVLTLAACAGQRGSVPAGSRSVAVDVPVGATVGLRLPAGEIVIRGVAGQHIAATAELACEERDRGCQRRAEKTGFATRVEPAAVLVALQPDGLSAWRDVQASIAVTVPADAALQLDIGAGSLTVEGLRNCIELDMYAGEATLKIDRSAPAAVTLDVGTGDTALVVDGRRIEGRRALLVGAELDWAAGRGDCVVHGDLQFGELEVYLLDD